MLKKTRGYICSVLVIVLCVYVLASACESEPNHFQFERAGIEDEHILSYFKGRYFKNMFWIDEDNCLFAFSPFRFDEDNDSMPAPSVVYRYSADNNKFSVIFEGEVRGTFTTGQSSCCVMNDGFILMLEYELLFFDSDYKYLSSKTIRIEDNEIEDNEYFSCVSGSGGSALIKNDTTEYFVDLANPTERVKASKRYLGGIGHELITADDRTVLIPEGITGKTNGISVFDVETGGLSYLTCFDSFPEEDRIGVGIFYPYDETHAMLYINGTDYKDCHDTYALVDFVNDSYEIVYRTSDMWERPLPDASGTWTLEEKASEKSKLTIYPFNSSRIIVGLEEAPTGLGGGVWINEKTYSFVYVYRLSENEFGVSVYVSSPD